ncbi:unnamed protein product [Lepeophtheirus salmonis]|uniref:(salmon louse) hypothetical protein n=1 Tax=Lepeophtheirus salmonis TaxID=72036 RepID=A0A7R8CKA2_LEPSM|nr:unnamed protein product [Lepeophtheirus salmonis]CAF2845277.1 unnamed protein product [Lepeophtheirus salmonis]
MNTFASLLLIAQVASLAYGQGCQTTSGQNCVFPSKFREMALTKCVKADYDKYWCATSNKADGSVDTYGDCNADCPMEVHDPATECITTGNYQCVFPFEYNGATYNKCTDADNEGKKWCAINKYPNTEQAYHFEECNMNSQCQQ